MQRFTSAALARSAQGDDDVAQGADWGRVQQLTDPTQALKALLPGARQQPPQWWNARIGSPPRNLPYQRPELVFDGLAPLPLPSC